MERNAALKQPFGLEENSDTGLLSCQHVTGPCLYPVSTKVACSDPFIPFTNPLISHEIIEIISDFV